MESRPSFSRHGIEHQNPVVLLAVGRLHKLLAAFVGILTNCFPRSVTRVVPLSFHLRAVELVHLNAHRLSEWCVGNYETAVFGPRRNDATRAFALLRGDG